MKIYLDTNIVFGFFKRFLENKFMNKPLILPEKMKIVSKAKKVYVSELVFSEIVVETRKWCLENNIKINREHIEEMFEEFKNKFNIKVVRIIDLKDLNDLVFHGIDLKDSIHLEISKNMNMIFVTDDKSLYEASKYFYGKVLSFNELRKMINGPTQN